jgi:membrane peptidoglycan carboxypeptidase
MKLANELRVLMRTAFLRALVATGLVLAVAAFYVWRKHVEAEGMLDHVDLQARNTSGASFYASKKRLFVGQALTRENIIEYLKSINFTESDKLNDAGTYVLQSNDGLRISPRLREFQPVTIRFKRGRIAGINVEATELQSVAGEVRETAIEPEALGAFIMSMDGDEPSKMFVRRYTAQFGDFKDGDLLYAIIGSEDTLFMTHNGTRFDRILINLLPLHRGGGSSITTQVVKNAVSLDTTHAITRKIDEVFLASALERRMSKEDILTLYVNDVFLGGGKGSPNVYGFLAAAEEYFGKKSLRELTLSETCTLVAMLPKPSFFLNQAKIGDYSELTDWRNRVLNRINQNWPDKYPKSVIEATQKEEVRFASRPYVEQPMDILCRAFIDFAAGQQPLMQLQNLPPTEYSGLHIFTSVDPDLMREAQRVLNSGIPSISRRFPPLRRTGCEGHDDRMLGAIVALDPRTGEIITMSGGGGGRDGVKYARFALNAMDAPASTIKPFWIVKALAEATLSNGERYTAASMIDPTNASIDGWKPTSGLGGVGRPRAKLAASADDFAVRTLGIVGFENGKSFYQLVTGNTITNATGQMALGFGAGTEVSPLRLARAYTIFGNNGALAETNPISNVYLNGKELENRHKSPSQVIDSGAAYITTQMMRSVLGYGPDGLHGTARQAFAQTGLSAEEIEMGAKTGSGPSSVWMVSVSPKLVVVVWLGYQCHSEIKNSQEMFAKDTAALIWADFIKAIRRLRPDLLLGSFERPDRIIQLPINPANGCRFDGPGSMREFFIEGTEPSPCRTR